MPSGPRTAPWPAGTTPTLSAARRRRWRPSTTPGRCCAIRKRAPSTIGRVWLQRRDPRLLGTMVRGSGRRPPVPASRPAASLTTAATRAGRSESWPGTIRTTSSGSPARPWAPLPARDRVAAGRASPRGASCPSRAAHGPLPPPLTLRRTAARSHAAASGLSGRRRPPRQVDGHASDARFGNHDVTEPDASRLACRGALVRART